MAQDRMRAVVIAVFLSMLPSAVVAARRLLSNQEYARLDARALKPGLNLCPPYPERFFVHEQISSGEYQNGGVWYR